MAMIEIKVPALPESVTDGTIATWYKKPGEFIKRDEHLLDIETDKVIIEVVAPEDGTLDSIKKDKGDTVKAEEVVALFKAGPESKSEEKEEATKTEEKAEEKTEGTKEASKTEAKNEQKESSESLSPSVRRMMAKKEIDASQIQGSGRGGRITTEDVEEAAKKIKAASQRQADKKKEDISKEEAKAKPEEKTKSETKPLERTTSKSTAESPMTFPAGQRIEKRVPMTRLRARIAERLLQAQQNAAILTTFNEINMQPVMSLRAKYKEIFEKTYGVRLGFMSFFTMAVVEALKHFPIVNASTDGNDIIYHGYYDIGIAVSSSRGLGGSCC